MQEYNNLNFVDIYGRTVRLLTDGIHKQIEKREDIIIPYDAIYDIKYEKASILNSNEGSIKFYFTKAFSKFLLKKCEKQKPIIRSEFDILEYATISFRKKENQISKKFYNEIINICNKLHKDSNQLNDIENMCGLDFEYYCAELLKRNGFADVEVTQGSGDQGVDILAQKDDIKYAVQCKRYSMPLGNTPIQEINSGKMFYKCHIGVVMTNSTFTDGAIELAEATGVLLWDGSKLKDMENCS